MIKGRAERIWSARGVWLPLLPALAALVTSVVLITHANLHFLRPEPALLNDPDEGYALALARRMIEGRYLPYVDGVSHRGPIFYWTVALAARAFGYESWLAMRLLAFSTMLLTVLFGFLAAVLMRRPLAGAIMALAYSAACLGSMDAHDGLALSSEHLLNVFVLAALACLVIALRDRHERPWPMLLFAAGALTMLGGLSKQVGLVALAPFGLWTVCAAVSRSDLEKRTRVAWVAWFAAGALAPLLVVSARYAIAGELSTFYYYFFTYNTRVYMVGISAHAGELFHSFWTRKYDVLLFAALSIGLALTFSFANARSLRDLPRAIDANGPETTVALSAAAAVLVCNTTLRDFGHYYLQVLPWAGLFGGLLVERLLSRSSIVERKHWLRALLVRLSVLAPAAAFAIAGWTITIREYQRTGRGSYSTSEWPICKFITDHSKPSDAIFLWGFDPAPYTACKRRPASRYVFTTFVAGYVPFVDDPLDVESARAAPGSHEILLRELEQTRPAVIVDSPKSMGGRSILQYDFLRRYLAANYCQTSQDINGVTPWLPKGSPECVSQRGSALPVTLPAIR